MNKNLAPIDAVSVPASVTHMEIIAKFVADGGDVTQMEAMYAMQTAHELKQERKMAVKALAAFKSNEINISKNKLVEFKTSKGTTSYHHAELSHIIGIVNPLLAAEGLIVTWDVSNTHDLVTCTAILGHDEGYEKTLTMSGPPDMSGGKNIVQAIMSTKTYLERHTYMAILGLAAGGDDDDGRGGPADDQEVISKEQLDDLADKMNEVDADPVGFCKRFNISAVWELRLSDLPKALDMIARKKASQ